MWKKTDDEAVPGTPTEYVNPSKRPSSPSPATIGSSIYIKGEIKGEEDLVVHGSIEGKITLRKNNVTIGRDGKVKAQIRGRSIRVEGEVQGDLFGEQEVVIRSDGRVEGNIVSPRVTLENGSVFKGSIDMDTGREKRGAAGATAAKTEAAADKAAEPKEAAAAAKESPAAVKPATTPRSPSDTKEPAKQAAGGSR